MRKIQRDGNIVKAFKNEINLKTRCKPSSKVYSRKVKHRYSKMEF